MSDEFDDITNEAAAALGASLRPVAPPPAIKAALMRAVTSSGQDEASPRQAAQADEARQTDGVTEQMDGATLTDEAGQTDSIGQANESGRMAEPAQTAELAQADRSAAQGAPAPVTPLRPRQFRTFALRGVAAVLLLLAGAGIGRWSAMDSMEPSMHYAKLNQAQDVERVADVMPDGHVATLTWSRGMEMTALTLPAELQQSHGLALQLWRRQNGVVTPLGMYSPSKGTSFSFIDIMPEPGLEILVTIEPEGGSAQPSGEPVVVLRVADDTQKESTLVTA
ncbi:anti-sigma factor [Schaalia suimastitidis]|uniref:anti-sigma factor n=1 Tax=Schaalia suimastitidis TaxID=121163 RepID=UPI000410C17B|nr:anti-sigma factor [Schaalia suimastitidis]